jgi:hypothetical protein
MDVEVEMLLALRILLQGGPVRRSGGEWGTVPGENVKGMMKMALTLTAA